MTFQPDIKPTVDSVRKMITDWRSEHKAPIAFPVAVWDQASPMPQRWLIANEAPQVRPPPTGLPGSDPN